MHWAKKFNKPQYADILLANGAAPLPDLTKKGSRKRGGPIPGAVKKVVQERITPKPYVLTVLDNGVYRTLKPEEQEEFE